MLHVGLTGGYASGKSVVGRELERLGCRVIRLDDLGHQVLAPDGEAYGPVVAAFGPSILTLGDSTPLPIDRRALGRRVFAHPPELERLNALVHPPIRARARALAEAFFREHPDGIAVSEAAILVETGSFKDYDRLIVAACRPDQQVERAMARDQLTREEVLERIRRQMPLEAKIAHADFVIDTSGTAEHTLSQTRDLFQKLRSLQQ
jgi:dephospho-CoA kinase